MAFIINMVGESEHRNTWTCWYMTASCIVYRNDPNFGRQGWGEERTHLARLHEGWWQQRHHQGTLAAADSDSFASMISGLWWITRALS